ncbi:nesprin-2 isoform E [Alligator mississippiensis]|uniref:Nesprin-2 isoform E n=1 Tax=Alligator mississippiensis TaxID=8496 RepID=A0A151M214_ALLMI|nr:nesprin-2 isoform E [Alligator mississippiensis]
MVLARQDAESGAGLGRISSSSGKKKDVSKSQSMEQENTQKKTFTTWINSQLAKHVPSSVISDLYTDIKRGHVLLDLLEVLSGQQLPREKGFNTFQCRSNIENALAFLKNKSIKLINIHVADIIEGKPSIVLGLIWTIISHFHIEELACTFACSYNQPSLDSSSVVGSSATASPPPKRSAKVKKRWKMSAKKALLLWAKEQCSMHGSINVADFRTSWRNGLAFLAVIHALRPDLIDMDRAKCRSNKENLKEAFRIAEHELSIPRLLEPEDVDVIDPDEKSIMTYVAQFLQYSRSFPVTEEDLQGKVKEALGWLTMQEMKLKKLLTDTENETLCKKYQEMLSFMELFNQEKRAFLPLLSSKRNVAEISKDLQQMREAWDNLTSQINEWKTMLDCVLPPPLDGIELWLQEVEHLLAEGLPDLQDHCKAMALFKEKIIVFKNLMDCFSGHLDTLQSFENKDEKNMPLVPLEKLEEMKRRFSNIRFTNFSLLLEYLCHLCSAIYDEVTSKLNIWNIKYGAKESVELLLADWHDFIEKRRIITQLETAFQICEDLKNKSKSTTMLAGDSQYTSKLFKTVESKISMCREYISNVNAILQKVLSSWSTYTENMPLLKTWLEEARKGHSRKIPTESLSAWNSVHGSLNEAGNFLIEVSSEDMGSDISKELKKLNRKWAKFIKRTQFVREKKEDATEQAIDLLPRVGKIEELLDGVENWVTETECLLDKVKQEGCMEPPAEESLQAAMNNLHMVLPKSEKTLSEKDIMINFEESQQELETSIVKAMQLVGQKVSPEEHASKYEEASSILNTNILDKYLKAAEQLKNISPAYEKPVLEKKIKEVCRRWEAFFSHEGSLGELNSSLQGLKALCQRLTAEEAFLETNKLVEDCEQKQEELERHATDIYSGLSHVGKGQPSREGSCVFASENGEKKVFPQSADTLSTQELASPITDEILEMDVKHQNGESCTKKSEKHGDLPLKTLLESFDAEKSNLELHLQSIKDEVVSGFTSEIQDASCLQNKLCDLEVLQSKANSCWMQFEIIASKLENLVDESEKLTISEMRNKLKREWSELQVVLNPRMKSLKTALELVLPIENESNFLCEPDQQLHKKDVQLLTLTNIPLIYGELKEIQKSIENHIEQCKQLEELDSSTRDEFNPADFKAACRLMHKYKKQFEEMNHKMQVSEKVLKDLDAFLATFKKVKLSIERAASLSQPGEPAGQETAWKEMAQQEISRLKEEAKCLDERLSLVDIHLEDAECGGMVCCEKLVATLLETVNDACGQIDKQELTQEYELQETFSTRNSELLKNIQDIHDKMNKIGLRDPTIPAVQQRIKSLHELEQELNQCATDMDFIREIANQLLQTEETKGKEANEQYRATQRLWEDTKLSLSECQEQCARALELLKQYQSYKNSLTSIMEKQENVLAQQTSYLGKENLQKMIAKIGVVREEFNDHSEDIDKINHICKNLQVKLNKMRIFEEPPFENEANMITDRWLDINEKTENYCDNLERALALWDKLLSLFGKIDTWANTELRNIEECYLAEDELTQLKACLQVQEKNLKDSDTKVAEIEYLLNGSESPLELQVIRSTVVNKMELIRKHLSTKLGASELNGNTAELKGDLDLAKTQIGMTESLLKALSPSDTLEIFTKLEEIYQKILQQKHHVTLLEKETGCLTPEVAELKKQLKSITDLFNTKKQIFQDHFLGLLNYQCKNFNDWFNSTQLSLKECFEPSETKLILEEKLQQLRSQEFTLTWRDALQMPNGKGI